MTKYYQIAEYILKEQGEDLGHIPRFSLFNIEYKSEPSPILSLRLDVPVDFENIELLYQFDGETGSSKFYRADGYYLFSTKDLEGEVWYVKIIFEDLNCVAYSNISLKTDPDILNFTIWTAFGIATLFHKTVAIHASTIMINNKAILFLGESGTGKSTHSRNWLAHIPSAELLNDDSPFVSVHNNGNIYAHGSPWSGKTSCYKKKKAEVAAFVRLEQAPFNKIKRLRTIEAIGALQPSLPTMFATDANLQEHMLSIVSLILKQKPVYKLQCLPDEDAVRLVYNTLKEDGCLP